MQSPSCERPKTNQRTLFLPFAINNCFPTSDEKLLAIFKLILGDLSFDLFGGFYGCITDHCNDAEVPLPKHQTSRRFFALFEKIYDGEPILTVISNIGEDLQYRYFK
jgi:hypothetical protein